MLGVERLIVERRFAIGGIRRRRARRDSDRACGDEGTRFRLRKDDHARLSPRDRRGDGRRSVENSGARADDSIAIDLRRTRPSRFRGRRFDEESRR